jgi:hypothetical protein
LLLPAITKIASAVAVTTDEMLMAADGILIVTPYMIEKAI